jgi:TetR/AcrR family transcriptional regulator
MTSKRRIGSETSATRASIVKAAFAVLQEQGSSYFTASEIARRAGVKPHMIHYYFRTIDDLILTLVKTLATTGLKNTTRAITSGNPLKALWDVETGSGSSIAIMELGAIAVHREDVRQEMARSMEAMRTIQTEAIARYLEIRGIKCSFPPATLTLMIAGIARQMVRERAFGVSLGHAEMVAVAEDLIQSLTSAENPAIAG